MPEINIDVFAKINGADQNLQKVHKELDALTDKGEAADRATGGLWSQLAAGVIAANLIQKATGAVVDIFKDSIQAAADYEQAVRGLDSAFEISGRTVPGMADNLKNYANELQALGLADDVATLKAESLLLQLTDLDEKGIKAATRGAIGLSSVFGTDLETAARMVAQGFEGNYMALGRMIPAIRSAKDEGEKHAAMMKAFEGLYQRAIDDTDTYAGQVKKLGLEWGETKKNLGEAILSTGILQTAMSGLSASLKFLRGHQDDMDAAQRRGIATVNEFRSSLEYVNPPLINLRKAIEAGPEEWEAYKKAVKATDDMLKDNKNTITAWVNKMGDTLFPLSENDKKLKAVKDSMKLLGLETKDVSEDKLRKYEAALLSARSSGQLSQDKLQELAGTAQKMADTYGLQLNPAIEGMLDPLARATAAAILMTEKNLPLDTSLQDLAGSVTPLWPLIYQMAQAEFDTLSPSEQLEKQIQALGDQLGLLPAEIELMIWEFNRYRLAILGIPVPELGIPSTKKKEVKDDVDELKGLWDGLFNQVSQKWGDTISDLIGGNTSIETAWNRLWKSLWETVVTYVGMIVTKELVKLFQGIIGGSKDAADKANESIGGIATKVGDVAGSVIKSLGDIAKAILDVIESIAKTVIDIVAYGIETLAEAVASAISALAAVAPELLELGLVAAAIYGAFKLAGTLVDAIESILGAGAKEGANITYWLAPMRWDIKEIRDLMFINLEPLFMQLLDTTFQIRDRATDTVGWLSGAIYGKLDEMAGRGGGGVDINGSVLLQDIRNKISDVVDAIHGIGHFQSGGYVPQTGLALLHAGEFVLPPGSNQGFLSARSAPVAPIQVSVPVTIAFDLQSWDRTDTERWFRSTGKELIRDVIERNVDGIAAKIEDKLSQFRK